jgi:hypothetical protein
VSSPFVAGVRSSAAGLVAGRRAGPRGYYMDLSCLEWRRGAPVSGGGRPQTGAVCLAGSWPTARRVVSGPGAVECLRRSADLWRDANAPYERARARALLARALHARGERSYAQGELQAARSAFESLGARLDLVRLAAFDRAVRSRDNGALPLRPALVASARRIWRVHSLRMKSSRSVATAGPSSTGSQ